VALDRFLTYLYFFFFAFFAFFFFAAFFAMSCLLWLGRIITRTIQCAQPVLSIASAAVTRSFNSHRDLSPHECGR